MEWLRRAPDDAPSRWYSRDRARCRREECVVKVKELKAKVKALEVELRRLTNTFNTIVEGQVRVVQAELSEVKIRFESIRLYKLWTKCI